MQSHPVFVAAEFTEVVRITDHKQLGVEFRAVFFLFLGLEGKRYGVILLHEGANSALLH